MEDEFDSVAEMAENGDPYAQFVMGSSFQNGRDFYQMIGQNVDRLILAFYRESATQGHIRAQMELGDIYLHGKHGASENVEEAKKWLRLALKNKENVNGSSCPLGAYINILVY